MHIILDKESLEDGNYHKDSGARVHWRNWPPPAPPEIAHDTAPEAFRTSSQTLPL